MTTDTIEGEIIDAESRALTVSETVALPIPVDEAIEQWEQYQELTRRLLNETDYQKIGNRQFKKKSAWRKYARAFNITDRVTFEQIERDELGFPKWARIRVEARAINGRTAEADHECHVTERCCPRALGDDCPKASWKGHYCCKSGCNGKTHWSHPGDLPATALTRAKNRAISDLIGAGEVSAEEMENRAEPPAPPAGGATSEQCLKIGKLLGPAYEKDKAIIATLGQSYPHAMREGRFISRMLTPPEAAAVIAVLEAPDA